MTYDRVFKNIARTAVLGDLGRRKSLLTLPSSEALCVAELLNNHTIDPATPQLWVERRARLRPFMERKRHELHLTATEIVIGQLEDLRLDRRFDLVNADLQCFMTDRLADWLERVLAPNLMPQASVIFWLMRNFRYNRFINWCIQYFYEGPLQRQVEIFKGRLGTFDPRIVIPRLLVACALRDYDFEWSRSFEYTDQFHSMVTVRIDRVRPHHRTPVWPPISDLLHLCRTSIDPAIIPRGDPNADLVLLHETLNKMGLTCHREFNAWAVTVQSTGKTITEFPNFHALFTTFVPEEGQPNVERTQMASSRIKIQASEIP